MALPTHMLLRRVDTGHTVEATRGKLLLIVGDMLDRLSSGYYRAVPHRVAAALALSRIASQAPLTLLTVVSAA